LSIVTRLALPDAEDWIADARESLRAHIGLGALILVYVLVVLAVCTAFGTADQLSLWLYGSLFSTSAIIVGAAFIVARMLYVMCVVRPEQITKAIVTDLRSNYLTRKRLFNGLPVLVLLSVFNSVFTSMKTMIPIIHPYDWDPTLMAWDQALHFGMPPWQLLQPLVGWPVLTGLINVFYNLWFIVLAGCWFWQAFTERDPRLRMQFFVTFVLCFALLGNFAATVLASGGPCFFGNLVSGPDPYAPLMQYLHQASQKTPFVWATGVQEMLWKSYATNGVGIGSGISAMPSMHLAGATLFALLGWRVNRTFGIILTTYAGIILIGSVHLGWHYAIDGYFAIISTFVIWLVVGAIVGRDSAVSQANAIAEPADTGSGSRIGAAMRQRR